MKVYFDYEKDEDRIHFEMKPENQMEHNFCLYLINSAGIENKGYDLVKKVFDFRVYDISMKIQEDKMFLELVNKYSHKPEVWKEWDKDKE